MAVITQKAWGMERLIYNGEYCMKLLVYTRECASSLHYHEKKHETFYVAHGQFELETQSEDAQVKTYRTLSTGDSVVLPPRTIHRLRCLALGTIVEASSHDDPNDCIRLEKSEA